MPLAIFPPEKTSKATRWAIAAVAVLIAIISGALSSIQAHSQDAQITSLHNDLDAGVTSVRGDISYLGAHTPQVPRLEVHSDSHMFSKPGFDRTYMALVLTVTKGGDDLTFYEGY